MPAATPPRAPRRRARPEPIGLRPILADFGIRIVPTARRRKPGETHARAALIEVLTDHGEDHLRLVLRLIRGTAPNCEALWSEVFLSVSDCLVTEPGWSVREADLRVAFDGIDLERKRLRAVELRPWPIRQSLRASLWMALKERIPANTG